MPSNLAILGVGGANAAAQTYTQKVQALQSANLIGYWPLAESAGTTAADESGNSRNGTYSGPTLGQTGIGDGRTAPSFDGVNDYVNVYTAGLSGAFNGSEGTISLWIQASWGTTTAGFALRFADAPNANEIGLRKSSTANRFLVDYYAGSTLKQVYWEGISATGFAHFAVTWSKAADQLIGYGNGVQLDLATTLGTWGGAGLTTTRCVIGAQTTSAGSPWTGKLAHVAVWSTPLSAAQVASLATV